MKSHVVQIHFAKETKKSICNSNVQDIRSDGLLKLKHRSVLPKNSALTTNCMCTLTCDLMCTC